MKASLAPCSQRHKLSFLCQENTKKDRRKAPTFLLYRKGQQLSIDVWLQQTELRERLIIIDLVHLGYGRERRRKEEFMSWLGKLHIKEKDWKKPRCTRRVLSKEKKSRSRKLLRDIKDWTEDLSFCRQELYPNPTNYTAKQDSNLSHWLRTAWIVSQASSC